MDPFFRRSFFQPSQSSDYYDDYPPRRVDDWFFQPSPSPKYYNGYPSSNADAGYFRPSSSRSPYSDRFPSRRDNERSVRQSPRPNYSDNSLPREMASPNVVHVPVHFVQADKTQTEKKPLSASSAALAIQRVYRGHLVRKSLNKIASIKREVDEIERFVSKEENIELIKRDGKEKLRVTETLMSLLLKLDSVRGVDCGVRELRKAVIRKAIRLQESLDDAVSGTVLTGATTSTNSDEPAEEICQANNGKANSETSTESAWSNCSYEDQERLPMADNGEKTANEAEMTQAEEQNQREVTQSDNSAANEAEMTQAEEQNQGEVTQSDNSAANEAEMTQAEEQNQRAVDENEKEATLPNEENRSTPGDLVEEEMANWEEVTPTPPPAEDERKRKEGNKEDLSLLLEENEKMRGLITELVEKNEVQTQLLMSLTNRVDQLERAFVCDVLRRKKKKCGNNATK